MSAPSYPITWWLAGIVGLVLAGLGMDLTAAWIEAREHKKKYIAEALNSRDNVHRLMLALEYALSLGDHAGAAKLTQMIAAQS